MDSAPFRIAVFAHNEERRLPAALDSVLGSLTDQADVRVAVLMNGCTDGTIPLVRRLTEQDPRLLPIEIGPADKCFAWNTYVYDYADSAPVHFFMDGDVTCPPGVLAAMQAELLAHPMASAMGGLPLTGRSRERYIELATRWRWIYGNLYAMAGERLRQIRTACLRLPIGLAGNDHYISEFARADLAGDRIPWEDRVVYRRGLGYQFESLQPWRPDDARLYWRRLVRYQLREYQLLKLQKVPSLHALPAHMDDVNKSILADLAEDPKRHLHPIVRGVWRRLRHMYPDVTSTFYARLIGAPGSSVRA